MGYLALYRQYRPRTFSEVVGQEHITRTLINQIATGRIAHAYLFCGSRGTGKTSTAKVFARAINCENPQDGEPCMECRICNMAEEDLAVDILEIDAASNNGVDEIRDLRDKVRFAPAVCRYKVYIIDEVHMLSQGAFNALLKTLEEPPAHAVFILATTEVQKLPATILSRCQRYDFRRIPEQVIVHQLEEIVKKQGARAEDRAIQAIARAAEGGMRDALSILDQCLGYAKDILSYDAVTQVLGSISDEALKGIADAIAEHDPNRVLNLVGKCYDDGKDMLVLMQDIIGHYRDEMVEAAKQGQPVTAYTRAISALSSAQAEMRLSPRPRICLEAALIRLCQLQEETDTSALLARIEELEKRMEQGRVAPQPRTDAVAVKKPEERAQEINQKGAPIEEKTEEKPAGKALSGDLLREVEAELRKNNRTAADFLKFATLDGVEGRVVRISFRPEDDIMAQALKKRFSEPLANAFAAVLGQQAEDLSISFVMDDGEKHGVNPDGNDSIIEQAEHAFGMQVEITD